MFTEAHHDPFCVSRVTFMTDQNAKISTLMEMVFPTTWLDEVDENDPQKRKNRDVEKEVRITLLCSLYLSQQPVHLTGFSLGLSCHSLQYYLRRFAVTKAPTLIGSLSQMCAALTHHVRPSQLAQISSSIPKVVLLTGDEDCLVAPSNSLKLKQHMPEAELIQWKNTGHGVHWQRRNELHSLIERIVKEGKDKL
jgi:hypothetical protein